MRSIESTIRAAVLVTTLLASVACEREKRQFRGTPPGGSALSDVVMSPLQPGPALVNVAHEHPYERNAWAVSQGKRLFAQMNCAGCHGMGGGGGMGPPLLDDEWIYGADPANIYSTIVEGRPNGMPSFRGRLSKDQVWQLTAYVRSLSGQLRKDVRSGRDDHSADYPDEQNRNRQTPRQSFLPPASQFP